MLDGKESRGKTQVRKPACSWLHTHKGCPSSLLRGQVFPAPINLANVQFISAGLQNGRPGVLANWNAGVGFRPDAIGWDSVWAELKKPPFLSWEWRLFLLVFRRPRDKGRIKRKEIK